MDQLDGWLALAGAAVAAIVVAAGFRAARVACCRVVVRIGRDGRIRVTRGRLSPIAAEHLQGIIDAAGIRRGVVFLRNTRCVRFSFGFPGRSKQAIRNVLLNQL